MLWSASVSIKHKPWVPVEASWWKMPCSVSGTSALLCYSFSFLPTGNKWNLWNRDPKSNCSNNLLYVAHILQHMFAETPNQSFKIDSVVFFFFFFFPESWCIWWPGAFHQHLDQRSRQQNDVSGKMCRLWSDTVWFLPACKRQKIFLLFPMTHLAYLNLLVACHKLV